MIDIETIYRRGLEREEYLNERRYYTYKLSYPQSMGGAVFYVGKGTGNRINRHEDEARRGVQSAKCDAIRQIWNAGEEVVKEKVQENLTHQDALDDEKALIRFYGIANLTNVSQEREDEKKQEHIIPLNICLFKAFRQEIEDSVRFCMEQVGLEVSSSSCHQYLQAICIQAIREHIKQEHS